MRRTLILHPDSPCAAVDRIEVEATRPRPAALALTYFVTGRTGDLRLPPASAPERADGLWQHTCFEAFVTAAGPAYAEFNLSPSTQWAAYGFDGHRSGMRALEGVRTPRIELRPAAEGCELHGYLDLDSLPELPADAPWRLGLCAVIEEANGRKSWWALAHSAGPPDFHHAEGFALDLPAA